MNTKQGGFGVSSHRWREIKSGEIVDATVYQAYEEYVEEGLKPSQIYLNEILEGEDLIPKEYADYFRNFLCDKTEK